MKAFINNVRQKKYIVVDGNRIYLNNKLTKAKYRIFKVCKAMRKENKIISTYNRGDMIFAKITNQSDAIRLDSFKDVEELARKVGYSITNVRNINSGLNRRTNTSSGQRASPSSASQDSGMTTRNNAKFRAVKNR